MIILLYVIFTLLCDSSLSIDVLELNNESFEDLVLLRGDNFFLVEFYNPKCGACINFAPQYSRVNNFLRGIMHVGRVSVSQHMQLAEKYKVTGVPCILLFLPQGEDPVLFDIIPRTPNNIIKWILSYFNNIIHLKESDVLDFMCSDDEEQVFPHRLVVFYEDDVPTPYINLSSKRKGEAFFAKSKIEKSQLQNFPSFNIDTLPAVVVLKALHNNEPTRYLVYSPDSIELEELLKVPTSIPREYSIGEKGLSFFSFLGLFFTVIAVVLFIYFYFYHLNTKNKLELPQLIVRSDDKVNKVN